MPTKPQMESNHRARTIAGPANGNGLRQSGIDILGAVPWGTHFCQFYETSHDLIETLVPYIQEGLRQNEFCMWVTSDPLRAEDAKGALGQAMPDLEEHIRRGQIEILDYSQWYTASGKFDADRVLAGWVEKEQSARQRGYQGLRLTGNTFWLERSDWSDFADYEARVDSVLKNYHMIALCTYALPRCNAVEVIDVMNNHQFALIKRSGRWEMMESRERRRAEEGVAQRNAILEGINRIFRESLTCQTEEQVGRLCLEVAEAVTGSKFGFIGEINPQTGLLDDIAISDPGWQVRRMRDRGGHGTTVPTGFKIHGMYGRVLSDGKGFFTNAPPSQPDSIGVPEGHPPLKSFLGVPLAQNGETIGIVAVGNREGGYRDEDLAALEALAIPIVQVRMRGRAEAALRESEQRRKVAEAMQAERQRLLDVLETLPVIVTLLRPDHRVEWVNRAYREALGDNVGKLCYASQFGHNQPCQECQAFTPLRTGQPHNWEWVLPNGRTFDIYNFPFADTDGSPLILEMDIDITERRRAEAALKEANEKLEHRVAERTAALTESEQRIRASLAEKEVLLKEIHHRVKNNMQVISSLVALQADRLPDDAMRSVLQDVTHRVRSMALVHEKLYQSPDMARVEFAEYAQSLLNYLWRAHGTTASGVRLTTNLEPVLLSVNAAVPCGLVLNELVSNALKHAFRGRAGGEVTVSLHGSPECEVCLRVRDNGVGLPPTLNWRQADSLGLRIVQILAGQLRATVEVSNGEGTEFTVTIGKQKT